MSNTSTAVRFARTWRSSAGPSGTWSRHAGSISRAARRSTISTEMPVSMADHTLRIGFAGDRDIAVNVLAHLLQSGDRPVVLLLPDADRASDDATLLRLCEENGPRPVVVRASELDAPSTIQRLHALHL